VIFLQDRL